MSTQIVFCQALMKGQEHRTTTRFYCFITYRKIIKSPKNLELDINVAKWGNSTFSAASKQRILWHGVKIRMARNTGGPADCCRCLQLLSCSFSNMAGSSML